MLANVEKLKRIIKSKRRKKSVDCGTFESRTLHYPSDSVHQKTKTHNTKIENIQHLEGNKPEKDTAR
jgi:hypothetical protein